MKKWMPEEQGAFRKGRGVEDHLFVLSWLEERNRRAKSRMILSFIDLQKAYDSVERSILWRRLLDIGLTRECIQLIQGLYNGHERFIRLDQGNTERLKCERGLRQGCPLSPILFALFIAGIPSALREVEGGIPMGGERICSLFYADDIILINQSEEDMARQLSVLLTEFNKL